MATVELVVCKTITYFSIWRDGKRKIGDSKLVKAFYWGGKEQEDANGQDRGSDKTVAYGPVLEWSE